MTTTPTPAGPYQIKKENGYPDWWVIIGPTPDAIQWSDPNDAGLDAERLNAAYASGYAAAVKDAAKGEAT